jgi:dTDP-glucose pyrophosphorylase
MMDGRIGAIRQKLETKGFVHTQIMAYSAKFASSFYGPFRDAVGSKQMLIGNKKGYQMAIANQKEALVEAYLDINEGADILIVKPAMPYLDIISNISKNIQQPIFTYQVNNPQDYGIVELKNNKILSIKEKPKKTNSNLAITGLYFFDKNVVSFSKKLKPSKRKELEIVDLLKAYLKKRKLKIEPMGRGSAWLDTGNVDSLFETSQFIANIEKRQGLKIACLEEIALSYKWILKSTIKKQIKFSFECRDEYEKMLAQSLNISNVHNKIITHIDTDKKFKAQVVDLQKRINLSR